MSNSGILLQRYVWLIETIRNNQGYLTRQKILDKWEHASQNETHEPMPPKTFHNHVEAIESIFHLKIKCSRSAGGTYTIGNDEDLTGDGGVTEWLLDSISINNLIHESQNLHKRILFEQIPSGRKYLKTVIQAMTDCHLVSVHYCSFSSSKTSIFWVEPWALKVFRQRWYLLGRMSKYNTPTMLALDRFTDVKVLEDSSFKMPEDFDAEEYLKDLYGVSVTAKKEGVKTIRLRVGNDQQSFFRTLPLHSSQKEVETQEDFSVFEYKLCPTYEFLQEILSHGDAVEVLSPEEFRKEAKAQIDSMGELYKDK